MGAGRAAGVEAATGELGWAAEPAAWQGHGHGEAGAGKVSLSHPCLVPGLRGGSAHHQHPQPVLALLPRLSFPSPLRTAHISVATQKKRGFLFYGAQRRAVHNRMVILKRRTASHLAAAGDL